MPNPESSSFEKGDAVALSASPVTRRGAELYTQSVKSPHAGAGLPLDGFAISWNSLLLRIRSLRKREHCFFSWQGTTTWPSLFIHRIHIAASMLLHGPQE